MKPRSRSRGRPSGTGTSAATSRATDGHCSPISAASGRAQRPLAPELERVDRVADHAVVLGPRPRPIPARRIDAARAAQWPARNDDARRASVSNVAPGQAAVIAAGRRDARDQIPARAAQRIAAPLPERAPRRPGRAPGRRGRGPRVAQARERTAQRPCDGRNVFQRWHCGHRSCQVGAVAEQAWQRWGQSKAWPRRSARRYSSNAARASPRRSNTAPRNACTTGMSARAHLELLELLGRLVEHLQLEVDAAQRRRQRQVVGRARTPRSGRARSSGWVARPRRGTRARVGQQRQRGLGLAPRSHVRTASRWTPAAS